MGKRWMKQGALLLALAMLMGMMALTVQAETQTGLAPPVSSGKEAGDSLELKIFHFNDTHAREGESAVDFAKIAGQVNALRNQHENVLLFDAGDALHGRPIANMFNGYSIVQIRNTMMVDAAVPGNHDFNYGYNRLVKLASYAKYPYLAANVITENDNERILDDYIIKKYDGYKIGIFGLATPETVYKSHPDNVKGLVFADPIETAKRYAEKLKSLGCDYIICLGHIGLDGGTEETSSDICNAVPEIDLFIDGHSHSVLQNGMPTDNGIIASTGEYANNVGYIHVTVDAEGSKKTRVSLLDSQDTENWPIMTSTYSLIEIYKDSIAELTQEVVGKTEVDLIGEREVVRKGDSNLGRLIVDALRDSTGADIALNNGGNVRTTIPAGDITYGLLLEVMPFGNLVVTMDVKGSDIVAAIEQGVSQYPAASGGFLHISGGTYSFDPNQEIGSRVTSVTINGQPIDPDAIYTLATNDFLAVGGDESPLGNGSIKAQTDPMDEIVMEYIKKNGATTDEAARITILGE